MKAKEIQDLISFIADSGLDEVNIETDEFKIKVKRHSEQIKVVEKSVVAQPVMTQAPQVFAQPAATPAQTAEKSAPTAEKTEKSDASRYVAIKSPMIGTFYRSSSPTADAFVNVGDTIFKGQVVCIVEAMKLFNEIESEVSGKIVKVLVENASPVEYDQELFLIDPS